MGGASSIVAPAVQTNGHTSTAAKEFAMKVSDMFHQMDEDTQAEVLRAGPALLEEATAAYRCKSGHSSLDISKSHSIISARRDTVNAEHFPPYVMSVEKLLALDLLEPHEVCLANGLIMKAPEDAVVLFVSHQWLSFMHPDPGAACLRALQDFLRTVITGDTMSRFRTDDEWNGFAKGVNARKTASAAHAASLQAMQKHLTPESFAHELKDAYVWFDFFSVPQARENGAEDVAVTGVNAGDSDQILAIKSIPFYVEISRYFLVVAPATTHADTGVKCDLASWRRRGWCRLEEMANFLSAKSMNPIVITEHKHVAVEEFADFWSFRANTRLGAVGCGDFTAEGDRWTCMDVLREMWFGKLKALHKSDKRMMLTLFGVLQTKLLASTTAGHSVAFSSIAVSFLATNISWPARSPIVCPGPIHKQSSLRRVCFEVAIGDDTSQHMAATWESVREDWKLGNLSEPDHPIGAAIVVAMLGDVELMRSVFEEEGYDVLEKHKATGATTIMHAAGAGSCEGVQYLVERARMLTAEEEDEVPFIDVGTTKLNITPLDRAIRCGHIDVVELLLSMGANPSTRRSTGCSPLHAAAEMGRPECAVLLLDAGMDIDCTNRDGATALHLAVTDDVTLFGSPVGKLEVVGLLLGRGANTELRDKTGRTAYDIAKKQPDIAALFESPI